MTEVSQKPKKWVFVTRDGSETKVYIKPTTIKTETDSFGNVIFTHKVKPVPLVFGFGGKAVIDEAFARRYGYPVEQLAQWTLDNNQCGAMYYCVHAPDKEPSPEDIARLEALESEAHDKLRKVTKGARSTGVNGLKQSILIGLPTADGDFHPDMLTCLDRMVSRAYKEGVSLMLKKRYGWIPKSRNALVDDALAEGATHLLFVDHDMVFDDDALLRLLARDVDIVSGLFVTRWPPFSPTMKTRDDKGLWRPRIDLRRDTGMHSDLDGTGMAFTLIKRKVLEAMESPYFSDPPVWMAVDYHELLRAYNDVVTDVSNGLGQKAIVKKATFKPFPKDSGLMSEDMYFCFQAKRLGFVVAVDTDVVIGHMGGCCYTIDDYVSYKEKRDGKE